MAFGVGLHRLRSTRGLPVAGSFVVGVGMVIATLLLARSMRDSAHARAAAELDAVAALKVAAIGQWRDRFQGDIRYLANMPTVAKVVSEASGDPLEPDLKAHLAELFSKFGRTFDCLQIGLLAANGQPLVAWTRGGVAWEPVSRGLLSHAVAAGNTPLSEFVVPRDNEWPQLDVAMALPVEGRPAAVVTLRVSMGPVFDAVTATWPVPSATAGSGLGLRSGDEVLVYASPTAFSDLRSPLRLPLTQKDRPTVRAAQGTVGSFAAVDFRGNPVLAAARPVPDSDWKFVTKMDLAEIEAPLKRPLGVIGALVLTLLGVGGVMLGLWWRGESAREKSEESLRESQERLQLALAGTHHIWDWDLVQGKLTLEREHPGRSGRTLETLSGSVSQVLAQVVQAEDLPALQQRMDAYLGGELPLFEAEYRVRTRSGAVRWHHVRGAASRRDATGKVLRLTGVFSNVTEHIALKEKLERADRMASLGTLAAGVAHEINNPLAAVLSNLEHLAAECRHPEHSALAAALADAIDGAARVRDVVRNLRTFSQPGTGQRAAVDVREELEAAARLAGNEIRHRAQLDLKLSPLPRVLAGDHELGQVFLNLLVNAAQAIPEGHADEHRITIEGATDARGWARVEVKDTGEGIPPQVLEHIFEPFFTTKTKGAGVGLGLAITHKLVTSNGGHIEVESQPGKGTTFRVLLPSAPAPEPAPKVAAAAAPAAVPGSGFRVLIVDDDPMVARAIVRIIGKRHQVTVVHAAKDALATLTGGELFDAILCDLMMPQMTGVELFERVHAFSPELARRMVFITGGAFTEQAIEFLRGASNTCLEKPFDPALLNDVVARVSTTGR